MQGGVRKKGDTWYYYFDLGKVEGKRKKIERKGGKTKTEAQAALRKAISEYEESGSVKNSNNITFADYLDFWFKHYVEINCKFNTKINYQRIINNHIKPMLGYYKLKTIDPEKLQHFLNQKMINGFSKNSLSGFYGVLSGSLKYAVYPLKYIVENPMQYVNMPKYDKPKTNKEDNLKIITLKDWKKIIERFPKGTPEYIPLQIAFHTGMRSSEVLGLTWDCVNLKEKYIKVEKILIDKGKGIYELGTPKTPSSAGNILIGNELVKILESHKEWQENNKITYGLHYTINNFVCTKENGKQVTTATIKYLSRIVNYELEINFNFHSLRHTHATMLLEAGANFKDIQKRLRHSRLATTMDTYSHVTKKLSQNTVNIFENLIKE